MNSISSVALVTIALISIWAVGVIAFVIWITVNVLPVIRDVMEHGTEDEKAAVRKAMHPPRFPRD